MIACRPVALAMSVVAALIALAGLLSPARAGDTRIVASILPLHSIAATVAGERAEVRLLVPGGASPHNYAFRPSDAAALEAADLVIWAGPQLETFLAKPLSTAGAAARALTLSEAGGLTLWPTRAPEAWEDHEEGDGHAAHGESDAQADGHDNDHGHDHDHEHAVGGTDMHVWLSPANGVVIAKTIAARLGALDPDGADVYAANAAAFEARMAALDLELAARLEPVADRPYVVFHDAYQYFERHYDLAATGAVVAAPDRQIGTKRLSELRHEIAERQIACIFAEPQFSPRIIDVLTEGTGARSAVLDPLGADLPPGPGLYEALLRRLAEGVAGCLGAG